MASQKISPFSSMKNEDGGKNILSQITQITQIGFLKRGFKDFRIWRI